MNSANAESKAFDVAQSQIFGDQNRSTGDGWPVAAHRGDHDSNRVQKSTVGYACVPTKERKSFAEIVRSGYEDIGDTTRPAVVTLTATAAIAQQSDCVLCDFNAIENLSVRSVLESVFDDGAELRNFACNKSEIGCATSASTFDDARVTSGNCANVIASPIICAVSLADSLAAACMKNNTGDTCAVSADYAEASKLGAQYQYPPGSSMSSQFFDAPPTLVDAFDVSGDAAPSSALLDFVCRQSPSDLALIGAHVPNSQPAAPAYPSAAVFVCFNCGEVTNLSAYAIQEMGSVGARRRRNKRFRNRGGHTAAHQSRRYKAFGPQPRRFRTPGTGKHKSDHRRANL